MTDLVQFEGNDDAVRGLMRRQREQQVGKRETRRGRTGCPPVPRHERGERFVRGPIPYEWLRVALSFGGKAGNLAFAIWWLVGVERGHPIRLTARVLDDFGVSPRAARRLLDKFQRAGLVDVSRKRGRGPDVTLLPVKGANTQNGGKAFQGRTTSTKAVVVDKTGRKQKNRTLERRTEACSHGVALSRKKH